jgi:exodeoxyribonuclease V alpha subunit
MSAPAVDGNSCLEGIVKYVKFHNENDNFYILTVKSGEGKSHTVCGSGTNIKINDYVSADGIWAENGSYGRQMKNAELKIAKPSNQKNILTYLSAGIIKGISKKNAIDIVAHFGEGSLDVIENSPEELKIIRNIGDNKIQKIINSWDRVKPSEHAVTELMTMGYQNFEAASIYKKFGKDALGVARTSPYIIHRRINQIVFEKVDWVTLHNGGSSHLPDRILAAIEHFIREEHRSGECLVSYKRVYYKASRYLKVPDELITREINVGVENEYFYLIEKNNEQYLQYRDVKLAEQEIARRLFLIFQRKNHITVGETRSIVQLQREGEKVINFVGEQAAAIVMAINEKVAIVTGKPGAGKTTTLNEIIKQLKHHGKRVMLCAPTGKAAQKMTESTGCPAATIHRLLEYNPIKDDFEKNEDNPLNTDVIVIDESSMNDIFIMSRLLQAISNDTQLIIIGDVDQLPSVQCGAVLRDLINSCKLPVSHLNEIHRQSGASKIITTAHAINDGNFDYQATTGETDFYFIPSRNDEETLAKIVKVTNKLDSAFGIKPEEGLQILTPMHEGVIGTQHLNRTMKDLLNPYQEGDEIAVTLNDFQYTVGDKVIQIINNYDKNVFNGDCGTIINLDHLYITVLMDNSDMEVQYSKGEFNQILPAYCVTVHKSQGSEYPATIIALPEQHSGLIDRSLLYTGITRGKRLVVVIAHPDVVRKGIATTTSRHRKTHLKERLVEMFEKNTQVAC